MKIGNELNLIQSPAVTSSSSEVADRLATIYERYLEQFDFIYVMSYMQELEHNKRIRPDQRLTFVHLIHGRGMESGDRFGA